MILIKTGRIVADHVHLVGPRRSHGLGLCIFLLYLLLSSSAYFPSFLFPLHSSLMPYTFSCLCSLFPTIDRCLVGLAFVLMFPTPIALNATCSVVLFTRQKNGFLGEGGAMRKRGI